MRSAVIAALVTVMMGASSEAYASPLELSAKNYLEGSWATHCRDTPVDTGFNSSMEVEFQRSGGSLFHTDGVDIEVRGRIVRAERQGRDIVLTTFYTDDEKTEAEVNRLRPAAK